MQRTGNLFCRLLLLSVLTLPMVWLTACNDDAIVGGPFAPDEVRVNADTINIDQTFYRTSPSFSGNLAYFTAGYVNDPLFGPIDAVALLRPSLQLLQATDTIVEDPRAILSMAVQDIYGMPEQPAEFEIVTIDRRWRMNSWRYDSIPDLSNNVIGRFSVTQADTFDVELDRNWAMKFRDFVYMEAGDTRDERYRSEMPGIAIVPADQNGKLFSVHFENIFLEFPLPPELEEEIRQDIEDSQVVDEDEEGENGEIVVPTPAVAMQSWAISIRSERPSPEQFNGSIPLWNHQRGIMELDLKITRDFLDTGSFSRVELVAYEDKETMKDAYPTGFERPWPETIRYFLFDDDELEYAIDSGKSPILQTNKRDDASYRVNMTTFSYDQIYDASNPETRNFYMISGFNDGRIMPVLIGDHTNPRLRPAILLTGVTRE
ncbi:hypothetical protein QLX67_07305 [Balneolaceae bacterium ANBcel3]|nr:hypothetical protein [Balneolaceae bacterium ANBcel3]